MLPIPVKPKGVGVGAKVGMGNKVLVGRGVSVAAGNGVPPTLGPSNGKPGVKAILGTATGVPVSVTAKAMVGATGKGVTEAFTIGLGGGVFDGPAVGNRVGDGR